MDKENKIKFGYWPAFEMSKRESKVIVHPDEYEGKEFLELSCTQTGLTAYQQKKLVSEWCSVLPTLNLSHLWFRSRVNQDLLEAAASNPSLQGLFVKWGKITSLERLENHKNLKSIYLGSYPGFEEVKRLKSIEGIEHLFLSDVKDEFDLKPFTEISTLQEFGISSIGKKLEVLNFESLLSLENLRLLWAVRWKVKPKDYIMIKNMKNLVSLRTEWTEDSDSVNEIRSVLPSLISCKSVFTR